MMRTGTNTMSTSLQALHELENFCHRTKTWGVVGKLIGKTLAQRNKILEAEWEAFNAQLEKARHQAVQNGTHEEIDGSGVSLANGGDTWIIYPDGKMGREFSTYPDFPKILPLLENQNRLDATRKLGREELLRAAFNALWGPSATNWQPVLVVEISQELQEAFLRHWGLKTSAHPNLPLLLLLRRDHYDSLLGDVMEAFGFEVAAKEESIDAGIYEAILKMSFRAKGMGFVCADLDDAKLPGAVDLVKKDLALKLRHLKAIPVKSAFLDAEAKKIETTLDLLGRGRYFPDALFQVGIPQGGGQALFPEWDQLVLERTTQRVASPVGEIPPEQVRSILANCLSALTPADRAAVYVADFTWRDPAVIEIGSSMFEALYGKGADPETKLGGAGGFLSKMSLRNYLVTLKRRDPDSLAFFTEEQLREMPEADLKHLGRETVLRARHIGPYLLERMTLDGKYIIKEDQIVSGLGKPVSVALMVKLLTGIAAAFGHFFLKFKNTHPGTLIFCGKEGKTTQEQNAHFKAVGKIAALLSYEVRRLGYTAITKTGPIDLAKEPIRQVLIEHLSTQGADRSIVDGLRQKEWAPAMVFQFGLPLAGSDLVDAGTPEEHNGLEERKRDKRPTRFGLDARYIVSY